MQQLEKISDGNADFFVSKVLFQMENFFYNIAHEPWRK